MKKKLNLVLREPVKLHETSLGTNQLETTPIEKTEPKQIGKVAEKPVEKKTEIPKPKLVAAADPSDISVSVQTAPVDQTRILEKMPPRVRQIWGFFCEIANADGQLKNSFTVTRSEVMKAAGIGSTNTYRDALRKFQDLGLITIELRPGVNAGSLFYLTDLGIEIAETVSGD